MGDNRGAEAWSFIKQVVAGRWFMVFASFMIMIGNGSTYIFGTYSKIIKTQFDYSQTQINTLGFAKDLGSNMGIFAGLLAEVAPRWVMFMCGAFFNFSGFFMIWLAITRRIAKPQFWQMFLYICLGTNSSNFSHTAIVVTNVRNFPERRGIVLGLIKGFVGIGGAILTQMYLAFYGYEDPSNIVLLFSWLPTVTILILFITIRPIKIHKHPEELKVFYHLLYISIVLALFIFILTIAQKEVIFSHAGYVTCVCVIVGVLCLPLLIVIREELITYKLNKQNRGASFVEVSIVEQKPPAVNVLNKSMATLDELTEISPSILQKMFNKPKRGEDFTILQALFSIDMGLIWIAFFSGCGSCIAAIDNLGQIGESLGYPAQAISIFVSWVSVFNFFGRIFSGFISEALMIKYKIPRPIVLAFAFLLTCIGHLCIAYPTSGSVYMASIIIGFGFGVQVPLLYSIISELFGLKHFSVLFNCGQVVVPLGSYILNVDIVGKFYDMEALRGGGKKTIGKGVTCIGAHCFSWSFTILAVITLFAALSMLLLASRTREFYNGDVYNNRKEDLWIPQSQMEFYQLDNKKNMGD